MAATNGSATTTYRYAGTTQDELVHQTLPSATLDYVYGRTDRNGQPLIQSLTKDTLSVYLDYDAGGTPQVLTTDAGVEVYYVFDGTIGNPVALINTTGTVVGSFAYDPYGTYTTTGATGSAAGLNPFRTAGGMYDRTTGWIKYGQRWYNPTTGRFTQQDSIERLTDPAQGNRYAYAADNPVNHIDPSGRLSFLDNTIVGLYSAATFLVVAVPVGFATGPLTGAAAGAVAGACMANGLANTFNGESYGSGCLDGVEQTGIPALAAAAYDWLGG